MPNNKQTGPFLVRKMPLSVRVKLKMIAASRNTSMEALIIEACTKFVNKELPSDSH